MKKVVVLSLAVCLIMLFSGVVMASQWSDWESDKGIFENYTASKFFALSDTTRASGGDYVVVKTMTTTGTIRENWDDQRATVTVRADAYIPCYLELELIGNRGYTKVKSIGPTEDTTLYHGSNSVFMLFHPELTGTMDKDWNFLDIANAGFSTIGPDRDVYIHACDMFKANILGNVLYGFSVSADAFTGVGDHEFYMDMRYTLDDGATWEEATIGFEEIGEFGALDEETVFMQFRVPFANVEAGKYTTTVTFAIYTT